MQLDARLLCLYFNLWWAYLRDKLLTLASCTTEEVGHNLSLVYGGMWVYGENTEVVAQKLVMVVFLVLRAASARIDF